MARVAGIFSASSTSTKRQKPTRLPYSCQAQFGMSGIGEPPAGGVSTVRGIVWLMSHSSILMITHTATRAWFGSVRGFRCVIGEKLMRSVGSMSVLPRSNGDAQGSQSLYRALQPIPRANRPDSRGRSRKDEIAGLQLVLPREAGDDLGNVPDKLGKVAALAGGTVY